ncbi:MAG: transporter associated domain-containing protein [Pseudomonadales bacterium]
MNDEQASGENDEKSWFNKLTHLFQNGPQSRTDLLQLLREAQKNELIDEDALSIFEGAIKVADMQARDIMIPRSQMAVIKSDAPLSEILPILVESSHSRFPVVGEDKNELLGLLLAKDLLPLLMNTCNDNFDLKSLLRPAQIVPESKRLNVLLREFRENRSHMVIVIDEYGDVAGLVTIEDVLEEIVGEIEDEYDTDEDNFIRKISARDYIIKALTPIDDFNEELGTHLSDDECGTIGGLVTRKLGHMPQRNEEVTVGSCRFKILKADNRRVHLISLQLINED